MKTAIVTLVCLCSALLVATTGNATQRDHVRRANTPVPVQCKMDKRTGNDVKVRGAACRPKPDAKGSTDWMDNVKEVPSAPAPSEPPAAKNKGDDDS